MTRNILNRLIFTVTLLISVFIDFRNDIHFNLDVALSHVEILFVTLACCFFERNRTISLLMVTLLAVKVIGTMGIYLPYFQYGIAEALAIYSPFYVLLLSCTGYNMIKILNPNFTLPFSVQIPRISFVIALLCALLVTLINSLTPLDYTLTFNIEMIFIALLCCFFERIHLISILMAVIAVMKATLHLPLYLAIFEYDISAVLQVQMPIYIIVTCIIWYRYKQIVANQLKENNTPQK
ncbi:hypothetical protein N9R79_09230 [Vibrio sp.]|nr:hypothetical protein [Vibrio sp.]